jgi:hypothetical protein
MNKKRKEMKRINIVLDQNTLVTSEVFVAGKEGDKKIT